MSRCLTNTSQSGSPGAQPGLFLYLVNALNTTIMAKEPAYKHTFKHRVDELAPNESVLGKWPELALNPVLADHAADKNDTLLRYCMFLGQGSGLHAGVPDWQKRKVEAARLAGISPKEPRYQAILDFTDPDVQALRIEWVRQFCSMEFAEFDSLVEFYYQTLAKIKKAKPEGSDEAATMEYKRCLEISTGLPDLRLSIQQLAEKLFHGDEQLRQEAMERLRPKAEAGSVEEATLNRKGRL